MKLKGFIERQKVYDVLNGLGGCGAKPKSFEDGWDKAIGTAIFDLAEVPAADVAPVVHGKWEKIDPNLCNVCLKGDAAWQCSECGRKYAVSKNGKKIFEGDFVREYLVDQANEYDYDCFDCGRVFWNHSTSQFLRTSKWFPDDCAPLEEQRGYEVIGNIHDNPELLGETK